jgi:hypothetical protein
LNLFKKVEKKKKKLESLQTTTLISDEELKKIDNELNKYLKEWKSRKLKCNDIGDQISDGKQQKLKEFYDEIDLETDEVVDANINNIGKLIN